LSYLAGGNFPKWIIEEYILNKENIEVFHDWEKNLLMLRYDDEVLVHNYIQKE
jgi:carbamoyl-phosphate synthase large subunit